MGLFSRLLGRQSGYDPAQRDLDELLPRITRVRVLTLDANLPVPFVL
jgi:hypothetical protein